MDYDNDFQTNLNNNIFLDEAYFDNDDSDNFPVNE